MRIHMRVPMFFWKHMPKAWMFCLEVNLGGNTFWTHTPLQSLFWTLYGNTTVFITCFEMKSRNTCAFLCFLSESTGNTYAFSVFSMHFLMQCACVAVQVLLTSAEKKNTRFAILQRWSHGANIWCSCHVSGPEVLPWSIKLAKPEQTTVLPTKNGYLWSKFISLQAYLRIHCKLLQ